MVTQALAQEISELEADFCSALSDPTRLLILYALAEGPHNVTELANELEVIQPTASRHLKILRERGLVYTVRQGTTVTYHLTDLLEHRYNVRLHPEGDKALNVAWFVSDPDGAGAEVEAEGLRPPPICNYWEFMHQNGAVPRTD